MPIHLIQSKATAEQIADMLVTLHDYIKQIGRAHV